MDRWALFLDRIVEFGRCHCRAADAVPSRLCSKIDNWATNAGRCGVENRVRLSDACCKRIYKAIAIIGRVKTHLAPDCRDTKAIPVATNARDDAVHKAGCLGVIGRAE